MYTIIVIPTDILFSGRFLPEGGSEPELSGGE